MHRFFYRSWSRLGPVLGRSWTRLGVEKVVISLVLQRFREHRRFRKKIAPRRILVPTWLDLTPKRSPRRPQDESKTSPKLSPKPKRKNYRKIERPGLHARVWVEHVWIPRPAGRGVGGRISQSQLNQPRTST